MPEVRGDDISVTPEEVRYLRRVFRRFALPYLGAIALAMLILVWALADGPESSETAGQGGPIDASLLAELRSRTDELDERMGAILRHVEAVDEELGGASKRVKELERRVERSTRGGDGVGSKALASIEQRVDKATRRIGELEASVAKVAAKRTAGGDSAPPANADLSALRGRLYDLEVRQKKEEEGLRGFEKDLLGRMSGLEKSRDKLSGERGAVSRSTLDRLENLEGRFERIEQILAAGESTNPTPSPAEPSWP